MQSHPPFVVCLHLLCSCCLTPDASGRKDMLILRMLGYSIYIYIYIYMLYNFPKTRAQSSGPRFQALIVVTVMLPSGVFAVLPAAGALDMKDPDSSFSPLCIRHSFAIQTQTKEGLAVYALLQNSQRRDCRGRNFHQPFDPVLLI